MNTSDSITENTTRESSERLRAAVDSWLDNNASLLREWRIRARGRRALLELDDHRLADIGISRSDAREEAGKPFWKA